MWTPADQLALDSCIARRNNPAYKSNPTYAAEVERAITVLTNLKEEAGYTFNGTNDVTIVVLYGEAEAIKANKPEGGIFSDSEYATGGVWSKECKHDFKPVPLDTLGLAARVFGWSDEELEEVRDTMRADLGTHQECAGRFDQGANFGGQPWTPQDEQRLTALKLDLSSMMLQRSNKSREINRLTERKRLAKRRDAEAAEKLRDQHKQAVHTINRALAEPGPSIADVLINNASDLRAALAPFDATSKNG